MAGKILQKVASFFAGGVASSVMDVADQAADIVERWNPGEAKKHEMTKELIGILSARDKDIAQNVENARQHDQPMNSGIAIADALVNGVNRLIRPWVTITVVGHLFGYWELPPPESIDPNYWEATMLVLGFWFGGRAVFKDLPAAIKFLRTG